MSRPSAAAARAQLGAEHGMSLIEVLVAALILVIGLLATVTVLTSSSQLVTGSERLEVAVARGERELERIRVIPFARLELASAPVYDADPRDPRSAVQPAGGGQPARYDWDLTSSVNDWEPLVIAASPSANPDAVVTHQPWSDGRWSGHVDVFVTQVGSDLRRVTVAVTVDGDRAPKLPVLLSTLLSATAEPS